MRFSKYVKDKINFILAFIVYCIIIALYTIAMRTNINVIIFILANSCIFFIVGFFINFFIKNKYIQNINKIMDDLEEKYLITEIITKPRREENLAYYKILKRTSKSMIENVTDVRISKEDYKEYIESWVHEVKIPITSAKLLCENNKSEVTRKIDEEVEKVNNFVEQALFYARLEQVSNDFMVRKLNLEEVIRMVLARNKKLMIQNNMKVEINNIDITVYTDEKWLEFILNQIIINAVKYKKEDNAKIVIETKKTYDSLQLFITDNGIGIKQSEIQRIFDKGFTGTNGRNDRKSTGIGLYLCKKLCEKLGMEIAAESVENSYTRIIIIFQ